MNGNDLKRTFLAWKEFTSGQKVSITVRETVLKAWQRCEELGAPIDGLNVQQLLTKDLNGLKDNNRELIKAAKPLMKQLFSQIDYSKSLLILADSEGYLIEIAGNQEMQEHLNELDITEGVQVSEVEMGNNCVDCSIRLQKPIKIEGPEHYNRSFHNWNCYGSPIHNDDNQIEGVLSLITPLSNSNSYSLGLIISTTKAIENQLILNRRKLVVDSNSNLVDTFSKIIELKHLYTSKHSKDVAMYSKAIGIELGLDEKSMYNLRYAALLHDIGKVGISDNILNKPTSLTDQEYKEVQKHPIIGANLLKQVDLSDEIILGVRHHHEYFNGNGYPDKLQGSELSIIARIIAVADAFEAMTSKRPYRNPFSKNEAVCELKACAGSQFDPELVKVFIKALDNKDIFNIAL
ncbi:HD domain-containing phosphohydrolase [Selenihalanaerobacter shriftii]|uniref:HDIG domain-containing protein n=1 Tax=Selenihalanaerobacter shriftii TaxID=142842 RepID=A0A1T4K9R7_9FIRM|nr:HD domain-containing phosphohydrolase [Selenihalanaerobacter shriftii]SJZ39055.1 HDIG domain-containing protein [Selenihalanaerobacter shriftii]